MKNVKLLKLKEEIKRVANLGKHIRTNLINKRSGLEKWKAWEEKRDVGITARYYLLAYGFLKGYPYRKMEPKSNEHHMIHEFAYGNLFYWIKKYESKNDAWSVERFLDLFKNETFYSEMLRCQAYYVNRLGEIEEKVATEERAA